MPYFNRIIPSTEPMTDILVAALSFREGLSLFNY